ncbi:MAG: inositol monophosphatase [Gammaproteobacteria bacterium]
MSTSSDNDAALPELAELGSLVAAIAAEELMPRFARAERSFKADGSIVTEADVAMQRRLTAALSERWPAYRVLGEEMDAEAQAALLEEPGAGLWCLDPLDGTSNFAAGLPFFAVSLALVRDGEPVLGLVYDPVRQECFTARRGRGAWLNGVPLGERVPQLDLSRCIAAVDFKRLPAELAARLAAQPPYSSQRSFGSVALDWCWLAAGRYHVYLHGRQRLWDFAAGWLILGEAGGHSRTLAGETVFRAATGARSALAALSESLFEQWRTWLSRDSE